MHKLTRSQRPGFAGFQGFTIVELLVVIVVIAILAAITVVAYNGIQSRAQSTAIFAALNQAEKKLELYSVSNGSYPNTLGDAGVANSGNITYQYVATGAAPSTTYCLMATQGNLTYSVRNADTTPVQGSCTGTWIYCAGEHNPCSFTGTSTVRYGANGSYITKSNVSASINCDNSTFGSDPAVGVLKSCYYMQ